MAITKLLTAKEVAELLDVPVQRVYELARQGFLPLVMVGHRQLRFDEEKLEKWIKEGGNTK